MLEQALLFLCIAQILHFSGYWFSVSASCYAEFTAKRMQTHLNWTGPQHRSRIAAAKRF
jgi:hypothetical protein